MRSLTTLRIGLTLAMLMLVALPAASASASAELRLVNARGGSDPLTLKVEVAGQTVTTASAAFGDSTEAVMAPPGDAQLSLGGAKKHAFTGKPLVDGARYTVIALPKGKGGYDVKVLRDGTAAPGDAKLRIVHAAPELGKPDFRLGDRTIAQGIGFRGDTGYLKVSPGRLKLALTPPGGGKAVLSMPVTLAAGTATTVVVAGTGGSEARLIELHDATATPVGAPHTGFGGLAQHDRPWLLALLAALLAGTAGGALQFVRSRR